MTEKTDQQKSDHVFAICQRAYNIALDRKISRLREKCRGDNLSVRLLKWHRLKAKNEVAALLLPALQRAEKFLSCKTGDAFNKFVEAILIGSLPKPRGRPEAARGIIGRVIAEANKKPAVSLVARLKNNRKFSQRVDDVRIDLLAEKHAETREGMLRKLSKYPDNMGDVTVAAAISSLLQKDPELAAEHSGKQRTALYNYYKRGKIPVSR